MCLFWPPVWIELCVRMSRVGKEGICAKIVKISKKQLANNGSSIHLSNFQKGLFSAKYDEFFSYWCATFEPLFRWHYGYVCDELRTEKEGICPKLSKSQQNN